MNRPVKRAYNPPAARFAASNQWRMSWERKTVMVFTGSST